jgi:hypothetical protein
MVELTKGPKHLQDDVAIVVVRDHGKVGGSILKVLFEVCHRCCLVMSCYEEQIEVLSVSELSSIATSMRRTPTQAGGDDSFG